MIKGTTKKARENAMMNENFSVGQTFKGKINGIIFRLKKETKDGFWVEFLNVNQKDVLVSRNVLSHLLVDAYIK